MFDQLASARFFRSKSTGISSFTEVLSKDNWVVADIDGDLYQLVLDGEKDVLSDRGVLKEIRSSLANGRPFGAGELHRLSDCLVDESAEVSLSGAEQSNSSIVIGTAIVKFFRKLEPGINPDVELLAVLAQQNCEYVPRLRGYTTVDINGETFVTSMIQDFVAGAEEGWTRALNFASRGESFASEARLIGKAVRAVHEDLASGCGTQLVDNSQIVAGLERRIDTLVQQAPILRDYSAGVRAKYAEAAQGQSRIQRIHGDLHLGQILRSKDKYLLIDFEGEPARPLEERRLPASPLQDVAGMLRSFDYAENFGGKHNLHAAEAFLEAYGVRESPLLDALVLDKALYEVAYETNNRPDWVHLPLRAVERLTQS